MKCGKYFKKFVEKRLDILFIWVLVIIAILGVVGFGTVISIHTTQYSDYETSAGSIIVPILVYAEGPLVIAFCWVAFFAQRTDQTCLLTTWIVFEIIYILMLLIRSVIVAFVMGADDWTYAMVAIGLGLLIIALHVFATILGFKIRWNIKDKLERNESGRTFAYPGMQEPSRSRSRSTSDSERDPALPLKDTAL